jgi:hypothetical protein
MSSTFNISRSLIRLDRRHSIRQIFFHFVLKEFDRCVSPSGEKAIYKSYLQHGVISHLIF